jgi:hypothetical protein
VRRYGDFVSADRIRALGLTGSTRVVLSRAALEILDRPWDPARSTAQPPPVDACAHARVQSCRDRRGYPIDRCALCGHDWR